MIGLYMEIRVLSVVSDTIVDGPGFRTAIYCSGCLHGCKGCHNPQSWNPKAGRLVSTEELLAEVLKNEFNNVTFTGGDPFYQAEAFTELARMIKEASNKTIWCFTGFLYEELIQIQSANELLKFIDVLVDGPFIEELKDESLIFRGSSNQRIINLHEGVVI